ncbi:acyltransferase [Novosphingobium sp. BL-8H]|uniref:acyltransferase family protein n=1 Tax=Novosphingobium sp. BL-8H TaxID=3127640 RepID=UPI0037567AB5
MQSQRHYVSFDGLRGVVATAVMATHGWILLGFVTLPRGYLGVDFFFLLSGFVIAHSYQERLAADMTAGVFARTRFARLFPMIALGALMGGAVMMLTGGVASPLLLGGMLAQMLTLPAPFASGSGDFLWPINPPSWSLFWEVLANAAFALGLFRFNSHTWLRLAAISMLSLGIVAVTVSTIELGYTQSSFLVGIPRTLLPFSIGVLLWRIRQSGKLPRASPSIPLSALAVVLAACFALPGKSGLVDLALVALVFPLVLMLALSSRHTSPIWSLAGRISYPLYLVHYPLLNLLVAMQPAATSLPGRWVWYFSFIFGSLVIGLVVNKVYDEPVRQWLAHRLIVQRRSVKVGAFI